MVVVVVTPASGSVPVVVTIPTDVDTPLNVDAASITTGVSVVAVDIPVGVENGNYMTLDSQGHEDINRTSGDLYVFFEEEKHEYFSRYGDDGKVLLSGELERILNKNLNDIPIIHPTVDLKKFLRKKIVC